MLPGGEVVGGKMWTWKKISGINIRDPRELRYPIY